MSLAIAIFLLMIVFFAMSSQRTAKNKQYEEFKAGNRKGHNTAREYYYASFYFLELLQKAIPYCQEYNKYACGPYGTENNEMAAKIQNEWAEQLTMYHRFYEMDELAVCKAREAMIEDGYIPSNHASSIFEPSYSAWKYPDRHRYTLQPFWPQPTLRFSGTDLIPGYDYEATMRDLDEVAENFGYHNYCNTILHVHYDEVSGVFYNDPEIEPQPWQPLRDKVMQNSIKENEWYAACQFRMTFGFPSYLI